MGTYGFAGLLNDDLMIRQRHEDELLDGAHFSGYGCTIAGIFRDLACTRETAMLLCLSSDWLWLAFVQVLAADEHERQRSWPGFTLHDALSLMLM